MMTKDKAGNFIFQKGRHYKAREWFNPVWPVGQSSKCLDTKARVIKDEKGDQTIPDGLGLFTAGDDTRWWSATSQFEEVN
jgi:hypothetical protein